MLYNKTPFSRSSMRVIILYDKTYLIKVHNYFSRINATYASFIVLPMMSF